MSGIRFEEPSVFLVGVIFHLKDFGFKPCLNPNTDTQSIKQIQALH